MAFIVKGLTTSANGQPILPPSAKTDLSADIANPTSTVRTALDAAGMGKGATDTDIAAFVQNPASATGAAVASATTTAVDTRVPPLSMETIRKDLEDPYSLVRIHVLDILAQANKAPATPDPAVRRNIFYKTEAPAGGLPYNASNLTVGPETITKDGVVLTKATTSNFYGTLEAALFSANATILTAGQRYMLSYYAHNPGATDLWFFTRALAQGTSNGHGLKLVKPGETKRVWGVYQASSTTSLFPFADPALGYGGGTATAPKLYFPGANTNTVVEAYVGGFQIEPISNTTVDGVAVIGDSTMAGGAGKKDERTARESSTFLAGLTNFQTFNRAVGGERTDQMDARWATDITPLAGVSKFVIIQGGINDIAQGTRTLADIKSSFTSMVAKAETDGLVPIVLTCTPTSSIGTDPAKEQRRRDLNAWLKATYGGRCIDIAPVVADPANPSALDPVWAGDGVHYTVEGKRKVGEKLAAWPYWNMPKPSAYQPVTGTTWTAP